MQDFILFISLYEPLALLKAVMLEGTTPISKNAVFEIDEDYNYQLSAFESSTNLISTNSSFENSTTGWSITDWNASTGKWRIANDGVDGKYSIECYDSDGLTNGSTTNAVCYQTYNLPSALTQAKNYTISAYAKKIGGTVPVLSILCYDSNSNLVTNGYGYFAKDIPQNKWTKISETYTVPAGTKFMRVMVRSSVKDKDIVRFDAVKFEEKVLHSTIKQPKNI